MESVEGRWGCNKVAYPEVEPGFQAPFLEHGGRAEQLRTSSDDDLAKEQIGLRLARVRVLVPKLGVLQGLSDAKKIKTPSFLECGANGVNVQGLVHRQLTQSIYLFARTNLRTGSSLPAPLELGATELSIGTLQPFC